ncbi:uncharacterized protein LOC134684885 [Mytilus trossulus]|uniref:uncharacterized protein LOC134684885 n=1 Tax=Mytilus trossulus TaxID=6551 RepID=UPI0030054B7D
MKFTHIRVEQTHIMSDIEESKFYLQLWAFTTGPAIDAMHMYFEINVLNKTKLETFLNNTNNKHVLFHQCFPEMPCCECNIHSIASKGKKGCLNKQQLKILFDDTNLPKPNHEKTAGTQTTQFCLCKYSAKCSINIDSLDITLFYAIVQHCCPTAMNFAWRKSVKDVRNFLAHVGNGQVTKSDFQNLWLSLELATYGFVEELGNKCLKMFKKDVSHIKSSSIESLKITLKETRDQLCKTLNHLNGFKPLCTDVAESKNILQSMQTQQSEQNMRVENKLEVMESLLLGIIANQRIDKLKSSVSVYDSEESIHTDAIKNTSSSSVSLQCTITSSVLDEDKALAQITKDENEKDEKQFKIKSAEKKCLLLHLQSSREIFKSVESLWYAINSLLKRIVKAGEIDTSVESTMNIKLALTSPVTEEERKVICAMLSIYGDLNEKHILNQTQSSDEANFAIKTEYISKTEGGKKPSISEAHQDVIDSIPVKQIKFETDDIKYVYTKVTDRTDSNSFQEVKTEKDEVKYDEIFVDVDNLKCLLKIKGLPNDLYQTELEERPSDVKGTQLLYVEWTMECPSKWDVSLISSSINDNLSTFHDEFSVDYVYTETSRTLIIHTTAQRCVFRSYSSLEVAVKNLLGNVLNVSNIKSTEPADLYATVLIMTKPDEGELSQANINKKVKTDQSIFGLKDNIVTCEHCSKDFSCKNCTSNMNHIRKMDQALKMKEQTIHRLEMALTKREEEMNEEDKSDYESEYSVERNTLSKEPEEDKRNTSKTTEIETLEEPEQKKRKIEIPSDNPKLKDASKSLDKNGSNILVDVKQALQKLAEISLVDYYIQMYRKYFKDLKKKWDPRIVRAQIRPKSEDAILDNLLKEKKKRTNLIEKLKDVIHNQEEFTTTKKAFCTDLQFLNVENPTIKCYNCQTKEDSHISCYCKDCQILICDTCVIEHRMKNKNHKYIYHHDILRGYKLANSWVLPIYSRIFDLKYMAADIVAVLLGEKLCTYNLTGGLISSFSITIDEEKSRIACINDCKIAVTVPSNNLIQIFTILASTTLTDLRTPEGTNMTGGITCRMDMLYVAFSDAIRLMDLSGQIQRVVNIPNVNILHSVNNDKMLCVYSKKDSEKSMSCLDFNNDSFNDFERFPFHPDDVATDDVGNIIFIDNGIIWQADSDGKNCKIIITAKGSNSYDSYEHLAYHKDSKILLSNGNYWDHEVKMYIKLE